MRKTVRIAGMIVLAMLLAVPVFAGGGGEAQGGAAAAAGKPAVGTGDSLEFVSCFGPGGGHDFMLRTMEKAIRTHNIIPNPILYTYKPGGNQAVGMQYTKTQGERSDLIMATTNQLIGVPLVMDIGVKREDLTDLALWGTQYLFFWVLKDRAEKEGWKTFDDVLKSGKPLVFTNTGAGGFEEVLCLYLQSQIPGAEFRSVSVNGDAEGVTQLLGGHVDILVNELSGGGMENYVETGEIIGLACAGSQRSQYQPNLPTLIDMGYNIALDSFRGVMGPPGMSPEAIAYWQDVLRKINDTTTFQDYLKVSGIEPIFMSGDSMKKFFDDYKPNLIRVFKEVGVEMVPNP